MKRLLVIVLVVFMMSPAAVAKQVGKVELSDSLMAGTDELLLNGAGFRKKLFILNYAGVVPKKLSRTPVCPFSMGFPLPIAGNWTRTSKNSLAPVPSPA